MKDITKKLVLLFLWLTLLTTFSPACTPGNISISPFPQVTPSVISENHSQITKTGLPDPIQETGALTVNMLRNGEYTMQQYGKTVRLIEGNYQSGKGANFFAAGLLNPIAFGDLNGDNVADAAVLLAVNGGGSGTFVSLVVMLDKNSTPYQASAILIDDRPQVNNLSIQGGNIIVDAAIHSFKDAMCCPTFAVIETYRLINKDLILVRLTSKTPEGVERTIVIESPLNGDVVNSSMVLKGKVSLSPFENNLVYRITDTAGKKFTEGALLINSDDMGSPGTFNSTINIPDILAGHPFRFELLDLSAADGSTLAKESVELIRGE
jgi:hypothetical protein